MFIIQKKLKFLFFIICFSIFSSISQTNEDIPFNNIATHKNPKPITAVIFEDFSGNEVSLKDYYGKLLIINFWATWCAPCKKEMPSLDSLYSDNSFKNLEVIAVNMEQPNTEKTKKFFDDLNIKNLSIFFDKKFNFVKEFNLRGVPTTVLINKKGEEFARIIGIIDFQDKKFLKWLAFYD
jgi:thiol-disulfide isomerase/thioredoxin